MATLPTTAKGTARVLANRGLKVNYIYYWCEAFRDPRVHQKQVPVRFDPFDAGTVYAFVHKEWLPCHSQYYAIFRGRSEREIMLASKELRRVRQCHTKNFQVAAKRLAEFLQSAAADETLHLQRLTDRELNQIGARSTEPVVSPSLGPTPTVNQCDDYSSSESPRADITPFDVYEEL
jgi:putative transposase